MIFFDASGKRWQNIKRHTAITVALAILPVAVLVVGSLTYQPKWGLVPLVRQVTTMALTGQIDTSPHTASNPSSSSPVPSATKQPTGRTLAAAITPQAAQTPTPVPTSKPSAKPTTTPTPVVTPHGNADHTPPPQSHKPTR